MSLTKLEFEGIASESDLSDSRAIEYSKLILQRLSEATKQHNEKNAQQVSLEQLKREFLQEVTVLAAFHRVAQFLHAKTDGVKIMIVGVVTQKKFDFEVSHQPMGHMEMPPVSPNFLVCNLYLGEKQASLLDDLL